ncbi:translation initiation factor IF-3 [Thermorudis peleae]|uniref:translation initiation factor IF-3 n=1 Tax=Thermorudis peleae TaxID=1382356 RepID=UPI001E5189D5
MDENGTNLGVVRTNEALRIARERGLDLVEVQPNAVPPVCRIMDYGKYRYEESRREREARKRQKVIEVKEIRLRPRIDDHDLQTKLRQAQGFLADGAKVRFTVMFRGREIAHQELGEKLLQRVVEAMTGHAVIEQPPHLEGRNLILVVAPHGSVGQAVERPATTTEKG